MDGLNRLHKKILAIFTTWRLHPIKVVDIDIDDHLAFVGGLD
jgi:hypothetical protein